MFILSLQNTNQISPKFLLVNISILYLISNDKNLVMKVQNSDLTKGINP